MGRPNILSGEIDCSCGPTQLPAKSEAAGIRQEEGLFRLGFFFKILRHSHRLLCFDISMVASDLSFRTEDMRFSLQRILQGARPGRAGWKKDLRVVEHKWTIR